MSSNHLEVKSVQYFLKHRSVLCINMYITFNDNSGLIILFYYISEHVILSFSLITFACVFVYFSIPFWLSI